MNMKNKLDGLELTGKNIFIEIIGTGEGDPFGFKAKLLEVGDDYLILEHMDKKGKTIEKKLYPFHHIVSLGGYNEDIFLKKVVV